MVEQLALPLIPCVCTEPGRACICPDKPGETAAAQVTEAVSKQHALLQELIAAHCCSEPLLPEEKIRPQVMALLKPRGKTFWSFHSVEYMFKFTGEGLF